MISTIIQNGQSVVSSDDIKYSHISYNLYIPCITIQITSYSKIDLELDTIYTLHNSDSTTIKAYLQELETINLDNASNKVFVFVDEVSYKVQNNLVGLKDKIHNVDFRNFIHNSNNQRDFLNFNLRKKGLILVSNKMQIKAKHLSEVKGGQEVKNFDIKNIIISGVRKIKKFNYYSYDKNNQALIKTKNGIGSHKYIANCTKAEIEALDIFLVPQHKITVENEYKKANIGDKIVLEDNKYIISNINEISYKEKILTYYIISKFI